MKKSLAAATMAASLTIGGAAGVALFSPTISGAQTDETTESTDDATTDDARPRLESWVGEAIAPLVEDGTITQSQSDAVVGAISEAAPERGFRHGPGHGHGGPFGMLESVTDVLGLSAEELREQLSAGSTLAEIAAAQGVSEDAVVDAIVAGIEERLAEAVADGRMTQEEADEKLAEAETRATEALTKTFEGREGRGPGFRGGPGADDAADTDSETTDS